MTVKTRFSPIRKKENAICFYDRMSFIFYMMVAVLTHDTVFFFFIKRNVTSGYAKTNTVTHECST